MSRIPGNRTSGGLSSAALRRARTFPLLLLSAFLAGFSSGCTRQLERPKIVLILADDLGWNQLGCRKEERKRDCPLLRAGQPLERFGLEPCCENCGGEIACTVSWEYGEANPAMRKRQAGRLLLVTEDADLFSIRFRKAQASVG